MMGGDLHLLHRLDLGDHQRDSLLVVKIPSDGQV